MNRSCDICEATSLSWLDIANERVEEAFVETGHDDDIVKDVQHCFIFGGIHDIMSARPWDIRIPQEPIAQADLQNMAMHGFSKESAIT